MEYSERLREMLDNPDLFIGTQYDEAENTYESRAYDGDKCVARVVFEDGEIKKYYNRDGSYFKDEWMKIFMDNLDTMYKYKYKGHYVEFEYCTITIESTPTPDKPILEISLYDGVCDYDYQINVKYECFEPVFSIPKRVYQTVAGMWRH